MFKKTAVFLWVVLPIYIGKTRIVLAHVPHEEAGKSCGEHHEETKRMGGGKPFKMGGQQRVRGDFAQNQKLSDFNLAPGIHEEQVISRTRLNFTLEPVKWIKGFIEGQFYLREDGDDYSKTSLYQAYIETRSPEPIPLSLKIGRQELCYGSAFFVGTDDFFAGMVWDAAKLKIAYKDDFWIDLLAARFVRLNKGTSTDGPALYGAYSSYRLMEDARLELYFFYHRSGFKHFHAELPKEPEVVYVGP